jgi:DNA-binding XRE family transcriptional regulator
MAGHRNFSELEKKMSPERRARNELAVKQMMAEMLLSELRKMAGMTQEELATALGIKQPTVSRLESQDDMQISTLNRLVEALGGKLEILVKLPKGSVRLSQFA